MQGTPGPVLDTGRATSLFQQAAHPPGIVQQPPAGIVQAHASRVAGEQGLAQFGLQLADLGGHRRLGQVQQPGGSGYLARVGHHPERFQAAGINGGGIRHDGYQYS